MPNFNYRKMRNGYLVVSSPYAPCPEGYDKHPTMPCIFIPHLQSCEYRERRSPDNKCCGQRDFNYCLYFKKIVNPGDCYICQAKPEETS